jgi:hypothetical protein
MKRIDPANVRGDRPEEVLNKKRQAPGREPAS